MTTVLNISSVNHLRTYITYAHVCEHLGIPLNGSSLERRVSKLGHRRSDKFIKHLKGKTVPTHETIDELAKLAPNVLPLFYCPLWQALKCVKDNAYDISRCFETLDLDVQMCALETHRNEIGKLLIKRIGERELRKLHQIGGLHALACLTLLRFLFNEDDYGVPMSFIDSHILDIIINLRVAGVLPSNFDMLICALSDVFAWNTLPSMQTRIAPQNIYEEVTKKKALLLNIEKLHPCHHPHFSPKVLGLFDSGYQDLILRETKFASESNRPLIQLSPPSEKGLYWLLKKLNQHRETRDKYIYALHKNNFYFYKPMWLVQLNKTTGPR